MLDLWTKSLCGLYRPLVILCNSPRLRLRLTIGCLENQLTYGLAKYGVKLITDIAPDFEISLRAT